MQRGVRPRAAASGLRVGAAVVLLGASWPRRRLLTAPRAAARDAEHAAERRRADRRGAASRRPSASRQRPDVLRRRLASAACSVLDRVDRGAASRACRARGEFFWLDLVGAATEDELAALGDELRTCIRSPSRTRSEFDQRPKLDDYERLTCCSSSTASPPRTPVDGRPRRDPPASIARDWLVTVRRDAAAWRSTQLRDERRPGRPSAGRRLPRPRRADRLVLPRAATTLDDHIDALEDEVLERRRRGASSRTSSPCAQLVAPAPVLCAAARHLRPRRRRLVRAARASSDVPRDYFRDV